MVTDQYGYFQVVLRRNGSDVGFFDFEVLELPPEQLRWYIESTIPFDEAEFRHKLNNPGGFGIDNIVLEVPEPATLSLLALLALSLPKRGGLALLRSPRRPTAGKL